MADTDARLSAYRLLSRYRPAETTLSRLFLEHGADDALSAGEASFARELVRGTVRRLNTLDWLIGVFSSRSGKIDPSVRNILRLGLFQILYFSDRVPEYAAVHESVELARKTGKAHAAGFVNALLRTAARKRSTLPWPDPEKEPSRAVALRHAHPEWMVERWMKRLGSEEAVRLCEANNSIPPLTVRVNTLKASREALRAALEKEGVLCDLCRYSPDGLVLLSRPEIEKLTAFKDGWFVVQDEASQLVTRVLDPQPGEHIFDLCSGTGIKTTHVAQCTALKAKITAVDASAFQVSVAERNMGRLGVSGVRLLKEDVLKLQGQADRILLDAPCSGLGVIRRRPDIKWNRSAEDITMRFPGIQEKLLAAAARLLNGQGRLVYSTCTTEPEETEEVIRRFLDAHPSFVLEQIPFSGESRDVLEDDGHFLKTYPHRHGTDGFFAVRLRRCS